jgi:hypothetical protein
MAKNYRQLKAEWKLKALKEKKQPKKPAPKKARKKESD